MSIHLWYMVDLLYEIQLLHVTNNILDYINTLDGVDVLVSYSCNDELDVSRLTNLAPSVKCLKRCGTNARIDHIYNLMDESPEDALFVWVFHPDKIITSKSFCKTWIDLVASFVKEHYMSLGMFISDAKEETKYPCFFNTKIKECFKKYPQYYDHDSKCSKKEQWAFLKAYLNSTLRRPICFNPDDIYMKNDSPFG